MMIIKKLRTPLVSWDEFCFASSRVFWVLAYSTQTLSPNDVADTSSTAAGTTLYHRLVRFRDPSVVPVLDLWVQEGRAIDQEDLHVIIKQLRKFGRYKHALQVYGALLNCYAKAKALEKAEATMQKMRELGYSRSLTYNVMMGLYSATEKYEKLDLLMEEMEQKGIRIDKFTYAIRLNAYAKTLEIRKMEMLLLKMEVDPEVTMEWHAYTLIANGYLKAGEKEKALMSLKKSEYLIRPSQRKSAYEILLTLYASAGRKDEVYRIWNLYKNIGKFYNHGYLCLLSSLAKLDCIDDVEKIYEEWEAQNTYFDFHVPNLLITMYCKKGLLEKAETLVKKLIESGKEPNASTWSRMAMGYVKNDGMEKAVEAMRKSILGSFHGWTVDTATLSACLDYLDHKGHLNEAEEMIKSLHQKGHLSEGVYMGILKNLSRKPLVQDLI
ncbi:pentatricopeptide repeat-containing protein At2g20710, mitochondrial-like isoform X2 [Cynara cardunculus var. scolymus]|uniref:pentatricopeptide repeat-containing protein At2g20710, mitochondrial-like isoform X2 n=1 Tax=Cynara cardunculus var. scolymus TaxID=59895 RepID=UPI000D62525E|nr:pentatricopeptide repeat-containing protein At2g20710, mitochondrial-like isoform X2 [Cynara cardunculus var. scolymus]